VKLDSDGNLWLSPSDLSSFAACEHLAQLELKVAHDEMDKPSWPNEFDELRKRKGAEHERAFLEALRAEGRDVREIGLGDDFDFPAAAARTAEAMRAGADVIYQAVLVDVGWRGIADFLERIDRPSPNLGDWSYQALDTKLARHAYPSHVLQLCFYSEAIGRIQGVVPEVAHVVLGTSERVTIRIGDVTAYARRLKERFRRALEERPHTEPAKNSHCEICDYKPHCENWWEEHDHLNRVAGIYRSQIERLGTADIRTLTQLAEALPETAVPKLRPEAFTSLRTQASQQLESKRLGRLSWARRPVEPGRGFALLPRPSEGDLVLDFEGHPFFDPTRSLQFLFGVLELDGNGHRYRTTWAHDRDAERRALEAFLDLTHERLLADPAMHVYHYGTYESGALKSLVSVYGTREEELDELLRRGVLVDLYSAVRQALWVGSPSYSLKVVEQLAGFTRTAGVEGGSDAVLAYERWLADRDEALLTEIAAYNEEDCRATQAVRDWLLGERPPDVEWREPIPPTERKDEHRESLEARERLRLALVEGEPEGSPRRLAGELLEYHRREARPAWWWYFARCLMTPEELVDDTESIGLVEPVPGEAPVDIGWGSAVHTLTYPEQEHKLGRGTVDDPATQDEAGEILELDEDNRLIRLKRTKKLAEVALPRALIPTRPYRTWKQQDAVERAARSIHDRTGRYTALEALIARGLPRIAGRATGSEIQTIELGEQKTLTLGLDLSHLFVQGPPGSGKTWTGARLIVALLDEKRRVGITSQSHKAIHNLLEEVERVAAEEGSPFAGLKKATGGNPESVYNGPFVTSSEDNGRFLDPELKLVAGTSWLFSRAELDSTLDVLVVDEAGQLALADVVASGTAAKNLILLGDPLQLAQVSQGTHPAGSGASVLEHLLADEATIPVDRGVFLERTFRMHPDVCAFISEIVYDERLVSAPEAMLRTTSHGTGVRYLPVEHTGNRSSSDEEAACIANEIRRLLAGTFTDEETTRGLRPSDFMVVTPYNAQVRRLLAVVPAGVQVGTVDKFQGREAPIVVFSMATSTAEDAPRDLGFLFSKNRLNVAISRAQCLAILVCSPRLLDARCRTYEEMRLVNALCRFVELAEART
jgi:uncharacterized protein